METMFLRTGVNRLISGGGGGGRIHIFMFAECNSN